MKAIEQQKMIKKYKSPLGYYVLSTAIPWSLWFLAGYTSRLEPYSYQLEWMTGILSFAGLVGPLLVSLLYIMPNQELRNDFLGRLFNFRFMEAQYILVAFFLMLMSILSAQTISLLFGYSAEQFQLRGAFTFTSALFPVWFILIAAPTLEELAWHSYGTDCLRSRFNLFTASVIFAIFWGFWHMPLASIQGYYHSNLLESGPIYSVNFLVSLVPFVLIMNWLYYKTNRNILLPIVFHVTAGFFNEIFATHPMSKVIQTGLLLIVSVYLLIHDREFFFKRI